MFWRKKKQPRLQSPVDKRGQEYILQNYKVGEDLKAAGLKMEKRWDTMGDDDPDVCDLCRKNEAAGWIPQDKPFPSGHMHPLAHAGCRCDILQRRMDTER